MIDPAARARLERWKQSLLDLSAENRLLDVTRARTSVPLPGVDCVRLAAELAAGEAFSFEAAPPGAGAGATAGAEPRPIDLHRLAIPLEAAELARRLTAIRRAARAELADRGIHTLWLGLGLLRWCDADGVAHPAPLWLLPVELERIDEGSSEAGNKIRFQLIAARGARPHFNQTLGEKLRRELDILLEPAGDEADLAALLEAAEGIAITRPGWSVERAALLGVFSLARLALWQDLEALEAYTAPAAHTVPDAPDAPAAPDAALLGSPVVAHLVAGGHTTFAQPSGTAAALVTQPVGPAVVADLVCPLDADTSQLAAVAAGGAGASFVLQGPPGTGKSQTIANLIVHCVSQGKSVLFVSEQIAALEVVNQRLATVGLGEFCLELHSHKAGRAQVLAQLGRVLDRAFRPGSGPAGDGGRLAELRDVLDAHTAAMHRVGPFGRSVHAVLGRLVELRTTPRAALAESDAIGLDAATFERRQRAVTALAAAAVPVEPVATHPWRRSTLERLPPDGREHVLAALDEAAAAAAALHAALAEVATLVPGLVARTGDQLSALGTLGALAVASPRPGAEIMTQLRGARGEDLGERLALIRAKGGGTLEVPRDPMAFLQLASRHRALVAEVAERFTDRVAELDAAALWAQLKRWGGSVGPVRFMALRGARAQLRDAAVPGLLEDEGAILAALEVVIAERAVRTALLAAAEPARRWFGELGGDPLALELPAIDAAVGWAAELRRAFDVVEVAGGEAGRAAAWRALVAQVAAQRGEQPADLGAFGRLAGAVARWAPAIASLAEAAGLERAELGRPAAGADHLVALRDQIETLRHALASHGDWIAFHAARRAALAAGVGPAVAAIERGDLGAAELALAWERATLLAWVDAELADTPALARFHGATHHAHIAAFADLDRAMHALVRSRALARLAERVPRVTADPDGELATLLGELKKQRDHRPLRRLFTEIPTLLPRLAPCLLMTPSTVAQLLDPALPRFDLVVLDEASQLPTAEVIGALARGAAAVVVGDSRQLLPARAADAAAGAAGDPGDDDAPAELPSVLDDCLAARLPELRLSWHYRSRHEDLIAFANHRYYGDRLQVFPAAQASPDLGIAWRRTPGVFDRARTRQNRIEAEAVVAELVARLKDPAQCARSIAVVTFSRAQQELIEDLLDQARSTDSALDAVLELLGRGGITATEPLLVKSADAVQGDERDVVLVSVGYDFGSGSAAGGALPPELGALSRRGGERRLDVAITRAREQLVIFSSFDPEDVPEAAAGPVRDLAALLSFARAGGGAARSAEDAPAASPLTEAMARALVERGYRVRHQIGCGAYKIDLAVVDPNDPDRYILAIEHDGAAYATAPAARDRDRLRPQVLAQLGWRQHRVWTLDWWTDPERETQRLQAAVVAALAASRQRRAGAGAAAGRAAAGSIRGASSTTPPPARPGTAPRLAGGSSPVARRTATGSGAAPRPASHPASHPAPHPSGVPSDASGGVAAAGSGLAGAGPAASQRLPLPAFDGPTSPIRIGRGAIPIGPYTVAAIPAGRRIPDDLFAPRHLQELGKIVEQVLAAEAPMHVSLLARRVGAYFGIGRVTQRVADQVRHAVDGRGRYGEEQDFVWRMDQDPDGLPPVRVAGHGPSARREIDEVPLSEIAAAIRIVVERAAGIGQRELVRDAARLLGFSRITDHVIDRCTDGLRLAAYRELIRLDGSRAVLPPLE